jgi:hypothetical protein
MRWFILATVAALLLTTAGCGRARSKVHGTITYRGTPVAGGTIIFISDDNQTHPARIGADGSYHVASVPRGHVQVSVQADQPHNSPRPQPGAKDSDAFAKGAAADDDRAKGGRAPEKSSGPVVNLPPKYMDPGKSDLGFDLAEPDQEYTVDLK